jgi:Protein of unknown function (DUF2637)
VTRDSYHPLTAAAVLLVATIAAVVSYMHVATLALHYGQPPLAAYLLSPSIDGMVATSSLALLRSARAGVSAPWLARTGLLLAIVATLASNVASGLPHGWPGAVLAGWPAVAFVVSAETAISMSRRRVVTGQRPATSPVTQRPPKRTRPPARSGRGRRSPADIEAQALTTLSGHPDMTGPQLAVLLGCPTGQAAASTPADRNHCGGHTELATAPGAGPAEQASTRPGSLH